MANFKIEKPIKEVAIKDTSKIDTPIKEIKSRPSVVEGKTYKRSIPGRDAWYITLNNLEGCPIEIFINSKDVEHTQWINALSRVISAVFRHTDDPSFLVEELKAIIDPKGGYFREGKYIPSLVYEIGSILGLHLHGSKTTSEAKEAVREQIKGSQCPSCKEFGLIKEGGCEKCTLCGHLGSCG